MRAATGRSPRPASSKAFISAWAWNGGMSGVPSEEASVALASGLGSALTKR